MYELTFADESVIYEELESDFIPQIGQIFDLNSVVVKVVNIRQDVNSPHSVTVLCRQSKEHDPDTYDCFKPLETVYYLGFYSEGEEISSFSAVGFIPQQGQILLIPRGIKKGSFNSYLSADELVNRMAVEVVKVMIEVKHSFPGAMAKIDVLCKVLDWKEAHERIRGEK